MSVRLKGSWQQLQRNLSVVGSRPKKPGTITSKKTNLIQLKTNTAMAVLEWRRHCTELVLVYPTNNAVQERTSQVIQPKRHASDHSMRTKTIIAEYSEYRISASIINLLVSLIQPQAVQMACKESEIWTYNATKGSLLQSLCSLYIRGTGGTVE